MKSFTSNPQALPGSQPWRLPWQIHKLFQGHNHEVFHVRSTNSSRVTTIGLPCQIHKLFQGHNYEVFHVCKTRKFFQGQKCKLLVISAIHFRGHYFFMVRSKKVSKTLNFCGVRSKKSFNIASMKYSLLTFSIGLPGVVAKDC